MPYVSSDSPMQRRIRWPRSAIRRAPQEPRTSGGTMSLTSLRDVSGKTALALATAAAFAAAPAAFASSHREAPFITTSPKVDGTDFYMFRSYEPGRADYVTVVANYQPLQAPYGGPNYFSMDPKALYEIHIDND